MHKFYASVLLAVCCLTYVCCEPYSEHSASATNGHPNTILLSAGSSGVVDAVEDEDEGEGDMSSYDKRVERYAFGLGRRAYTYGNGANDVKRLPIYNFGLGKRARPYSFGLGKRGSSMELDGIDDADTNFDRSNYRGQAFMDEKRNRPYSFGLGKRDALNDVDRRGYSNRYGFGLGRR